MSLNFCVYLEVEWPVFWRTSTHSSRLNFPSLSVSATRKASSKSTVRFFSLDFLACKAKNPPLILPAMKSFTTTGHVQNTQISKDQRSYLKTEKIFGFVRTCKRHSVFKKGKESAKMNKCDEWITLSNISTIRHGSCKKLKSTFIISIQWGLKA